MERHKLEQLGVIMSKSSPTKDKTSSPKSESKLPLLDPIRLYEPSLAPRNHEMAAFGVNASSRGGCGAVRSGWPAGRRAAHLAWSASRSWRCMAAPSLSLAADQAGGLGEAAVWRLAVKVELSLG